MSRGTRTIAVLAALAVSLTTGVGSASATTDTASATRLALQQAGVSAGAAGVALPVQATAVRAGELTITYPRAAATSRSLDAHSRVFDGRHFDQVVQSTGSDDVRMLTVLSDADAPSRYDYSFADHELRQVGQGYVAVYDRSGEPVALIEPAWAKDAHGNAVPTRYEINGSTLTQVVEVDEHTAFPVVADPSVKYHWWGADVRFSKSETERLMAGGTACSVIPYVGAACGLVMAWAASGWAMHKCLALKEPWGGPAIPWYWSCRW